MTRFTINGFAPRTGLKTFSKGISDMKLGALQGVPNFLGMVKNIPILFGKWGLLLTSATWGRFFVIGILGGVWV